MDTLVILPPPSQGFFSLNVLGLSFKERIQLAARKAGFQYIFFLKFSEENLNLPEECAVFSPNMFFSDSAWKSFRELPLAEESITFFENIESIFFVKSKNRSLVLKELSHSNYSSALQKLKNQFKIYSLPLLSEKEWILFKGEVNLKSVEKWLLKGLIKENEGFMSKHLERKISLSISRFLIRLPVSPNGMTLLSAAVGLAGAVFFIFPKKWYHIVGALLFWAHSVLDGCDGEIARLKFLESKFGGLLDFWGDNVVHAAVFSLIAYGMYQRNFQPVFIVLGIFAVLGTLSSAAFVYYSALRIKKGSGPLLSSVTSRKSSMEKTADFLARRDFIYLVILLAIFGKVEWFLWMGAFGSPVYFMFIWLSSRRCIRA